MKTVKRWNGSSPAVNGEPRITRARILLKVDGDLTDAIISEHVGCHPLTAHNTRKAYCKRGLAAIHHRKPDREYKRKLDGNSESHLIKLTCSEPPERHSRLTLYLLADELVTLDEIDFGLISQEAVRQRVKNAPKPHLSSCCEIPPEQDAEFVFHMEDVLDLHDKS